MADTGQAGGQVAANVAPPKVSGVPQAQTVTDLHTSNVNLSTARSSREIGKPNPANPSSVR